MTPIITVTAIPLDVPLARTDIHAGFLRDQLHAHAALGPDKVHGVSHDGNSARAHIPTTVDPQLVADITAALQGFERRIGGTEARDTALAEARSKYGEKAANLVMYGQGNNYMNAYACSVIGIPMPLVFQPMVDLGLDKDTFEKVRDGQAYFESRINTWDIRSILLAELRARFGEKIDNIALFTPTATHPDYAAHVTVRGDYAPETIAAIHEVTAAHDASKAPPEPPDPQVLLLGTITAMNNQMKGMLKKIEALEAQIAELKGKK